MARILTVLENGGVGVLESPTGTGKTLSIICAAVPWLLHQRNAAPASPHLPATQVSQEGSPEGVPGWVREFEASQRAERRSRAELLHAARRERVLAKKRIVDEGDGAARARQRRNWALSKGMKSKRKSNGGAGSDEEFVLEDFDVDGLVAEAEKADWRASAYSSDDEEEEEGGDQLEDEDEWTPRKIFFCSRTHSQLSQFVSELRRTPFASSVPFVVLGSRKQMCSNPAASSSSHVNDICLDLADRAKKERSQSTSKGSRSRVNYGELIRNRIPSKSICPMYDRNEVLKMREEILYEAQDIENIVSSAAKKGTCAYYASRASVREAEIVALPYSTLLHRKTRESMGIDLKGNVIIFDEAHNVIEAINQVHSVRLFRKDLLQAHQELLEYRERYRSRLKPSNRAGINNLILITKGLGERFAKVKGASEVLAVNDLAQQSGFDHVNLFDLLNFLESSRLATKLRGFAKKYMSEVSVHPKVKRARISLPTQSSKSPAPLLPVQAFIEGISNQNQDGKVLVVAVKEEPFMRFLMLNPGVYFREIVDEAHSVILAGGTMHPTEDVERQLFGHVPKSQIEIFACGHVIPKENVVCLCLRQGPTKTELELNFQKRSDPRTMDEIARSLINMSNAVPEGVVVFLPSYQYAEKLFERWRSVGLLERLSRIKTVFRDNKSETGDTLLQSYEKATKSGNGAILFSVVGGKLSEGINFKDHLARCVVMVGMPYPNPQDPELKAKIDYIEKTKVFASGSMEFYENQCMKAVNQCIGRAIRHRDDFAVIVLMDSRYSKPSIHAKLPKWITNAKINVASFGEFFKELRNFFLKRNPPRTT